MTVAKSMAAVTSQSKVYQKGSYLPAEMRVEVGAAHFIALYVVDDNRDDGWPSSKKRSNDERRPQYPHENAERMQ